MRHRVARKPSESGSSLETIAIGLRVQVLGSSIENSSWAGMFMMSGPGALFT
jgi:hypothetical protein